MAGVNQLQVNPKVGLIFASGLSSILRSGPDAYMRVEPFLTSSAVDCVIPQWLARRLCERCKRPVEVDEVPLSELGFPFERFTGDRRFHEAVGCEGVGSRGRVGISEMMVVNEEIRGLILRRASADEMRRAAEEDGMVPLRQDGLLKAARGVTTIEQVLRTAV